MRGQDNGQLDPESRQAAVEAYWQETEADWADQRAQSESGHGQDQERAQSEEQSAGVDRPGGSDKRPPGNTVVPAGVRDAAIRDYLAGSDSLERVAKRHGISRGYLGKEVRQGGKQKPRRDDEVEALRAVLNILEDQPPEICQRVLAYAANYKGVSHQ